MTIKRYLRTTAIVALIMIGAVLIGMAAPSSVTNLKNVTYAQTYINWTWADPADGNFSNVSVYINGTFMTNINKSQQYYNFTTASPDTSYTIDTYTQDTNGSKNTTPVSNTSRTAPLNVILPQNTTPSISGVSHNNVTENSADITFTVNQSNAISRVLYGNDSTLLNGTTWSIWKNDSSPRTIQISGLTRSILYYYSIYASNASNQSLVTNTSIQSFTTLNPTTPNITSVTNDVASASSINFTITVNQSDAFIGIKYGENTSLDNGFEWNTNDSGSPRTRKLTSLAPGKTYFYSVFAFNKSNQSYSNNTTIQNFTTKYPAPTISSYDPSTSTPPDMLIGETKNLTIVIGSTQSGNLSWYENNNTSPFQSKPVNASESITYNFSRTAKGTYKITANLSNVNGSDTRVWTIKVIPTTFSTGNRIWDGSKPEDFALKYSWTPMSFSGFYYNAKDDVGNEKITIDLGSSYRPSTISKYNLVYTTSPQDVSFTTTKFGKYQVIGFMAEKYFAGYGPNTTSTKTRPSTDFVGKSAVGQGQLHKVLTDDDTKRTISVGGTLALQEGYVLKATDIDLNARTMLLSLLKDGTEVDVSPLSADETYVYSKKVGGVESLPLIMIRFDSVFSGTELQVAFLKGIFQISEYPTIIKTGNKFRNMEVTTVSSTLIEMKNSNDIGLSKGTTADVMGDVKILVANNDSVTRFALSVERTGSFEVRSTVYSDANPIKEWTPYNFGMNIGKTSIGFFYDLDEGIGGEKLTLDSISGRTIPETKLVYSTSPQEVKFIYTGFGKYQVIGFMADKYFAGYTPNTGISSLGKINTRPTTDFGGKSSLANGALHKVLIDDDTKRTISVGGTIALKEGYVIKATDIDLNARTMLLSLLKDGSEVDLTPLSAGETYVYTKTVGGTESLPLIMVRFETVFSGREIQAAFMKGIFQISDTPTKVKVSDQFGKMEIRSVTKDQITMSNDGSIGLDKNKNEVLMGNLRLKTADNDNLRFYFAVDVTQDMIASQLAINAPAKAMAGDTIQIKVTAGTIAIDNATISIGNETGTTDKNGTLNYTLPRSLKGTYSITASMTGYEKATQNIEIEKYVDLRLSIEAPSQANQFETITIKVLYNGTVMNGAAVKFDNTSVGTTDSNGEVTYKLETSGTHSISASKLSYITASRDIEIRAPYSEFKALDINITPNSGYVGEPFLIRSNITNIGTKSDSLQVELIINSTAVDNKTITLGAKEKVEVNFTRIENKVGNVTVEIMGQSMLFEAKEKPTNYLLIGAIVTGIGIVIIYILTSKGLLSLEILKDKFGLLAEKFNLLFKR